jgi:hypothetical protein
VVDTGELLPWMEQWQFESVEGMVCGGGAETGIGVNRGSDPSEMAIYMVGGGACWDAWTCFGLESAENLETAWGQVHMERELTLIQGSGLLDRSDATSPFSKASWVYIPYCTGDLHSGDSVREYDPVFNAGRLVHHAGENNLKLVVERLVQTHPDLERIWLIGGSAGGYAAQLQAHKFAGAWPDAELSVFADGAPMIQPGEGRWGAWRSAWNVEMPAECTDCTSSFPAMLSARSAALPDVPFSLAVSSEDPVITLFFAQPVGGMNAALSGLISSHYSDSEQLSVFRETGTNHVLLGDAQNHVAEDGTVLHDWFMDWAEGEPLSDHP